MSCAPFLISLSSSGKRNDSVSRESSVHSMMSMNCFLMKSRIAIGMPCRWWTMVGAAGDAGGGRAAARGRLRLGRGRDLLELGFGRSHFLLELRKLQRTRHHRAVGEDQRRRGDDLESVAELLRLRHRVAAVAGVVGPLAAGEEIVPRLHVVRCAPDL